MSEVRLVIRDTFRDLYANCHASFAERAVAALSADPETLEELDLAMERFSASTPHGNFAGFRTGVDDQPYDAGVVIIDLAARLIVGETTYFSASLTGYVQYHDGWQATTANLRFHLADDWVVSSDSMDWQAQADHLRRKRESSPHLDGRSVLYGRPLCEFIARESWTAFALSASARAPKDADDDAIRQIHVRWMMTPRDDLRGTSPRDLLTGRREHISWDLQDRQEQWSQLDECPPGVATTSAAYRFGGFGTHELVVYYDLVRFLLHLCRESIEQSTSTTASDFPTEGVFLSAEVPRLLSMHDQWLDSPEPEFSGRTPRRVIENERARMPEGMTGHEAIIDCDCPICQMQADMPGPVFWGLDGSGMDDEFAFSFHRTFEEWESEQRKYEEFNRRFEAQQAERRNLGVESFNGSYADPDDVWTRSFSAPESESDTLFMRLFAVGSHLAELIADLKHPRDSADPATGPRPLIDRLSRDFGNLREVAGADDASAESIFEPVLNRFCDALEDVAAERPDLQSKSADLQRRLRRFLATGDADVSLDDFGDELPF